MKEIQEVVKALEQEKQDLEINILYFNQYGNKSSKDIEELYGYIEEHSKLEYKIEIFKQVKNYLNQ